MNHSPSLSYFEKVVLFCNLYRSITSDRDYLSLMSSSIEGKAIISPSMVLSLLSPLWIVISLALRHSMMRCALCATLDASLRAVAVYALSISLKKVSMLLRKAVWSDCLKYLRFEFSMMHLLNSFQFYLYRLARSAMAAALTSSCGACGLLHLM